MFFGKDFPLDCDTCGDRQCEFFDFVEYLNSSYWFIVVGIHDPNCVFAFLYISIDIFALFVCLFLQASSPPLIRRSFHESNPGTFNRRTIYLVDDFDCELSTFPKFNNSEIYCFSFFQLQIRDCLRFVASWWKGDWDITSPQFTHVKGAIFGIERAASYPVVPKPVRIIT